MIRGYRSAARLGSLAIAIFAVIVTVLVCEAALRLIRPHDNVHRTATLGIYAADAELGWVLRPNLRHTRDWIGRSVTILTDQHGQRIAEGEAEPAEGTKIVFAGDSFVFGNEVNAEETFVHLIGKAAGPSRDAVNLGVGAYFLSQECLSLRRYLARDVSVAGAFLGLYIGNDLEAGRYPPATMGLDGNGYLRPRAGTDLDAALRPLPITVVLIPEYDQVYGPLGDLPNRMMASALAELGMPVVDLLPRMRSAAAGGASLYNEVVGGHLSLQGHRLVAEILSEHL